MMPHCVCDQRSSGVFPRNLGGNTAESDTFAVLQLFGILRRCVVPTAILIKGGRIDIVYGTDLVLGLESALAGGMRWYVWNTHQCGEVM